MKSIDLFVAMTLAARFDSMSVQDVHAQSPTTDPPAACATFVPHPSNEAAPLKTALNRFDSALATADAHRFQALGIEPGTLKQWQDFFERNPADRVTDTCPASELSIATEAAIWSRTEFTKLATFELRRFARQPPPTSALQHSALSLCGAHAAY